MPNQLTTAGNRNLTTAPEISPYREAVNDEGANDFGVFIRFRKGEWQLGEKDEEVPNNARFIANMEEYYRGWVRWQNGKPTNHLIGRVIDRYRVPAREELGDLDESKWETEPNGVRKDPWSKTVYLALRSEQDEDNVYCFTSSSDGGRKAAAKLADRFDRLRHKYSGRMPVVELQAESYQHPQYGKVWKPVFKIVGWEFWDEEASDEAAARIDSKQATDDELSDSIPF